jgi:hypothetical protein
VGRSSSWVSKFGRSRLDGQVEVFKSGCRSGCRLGCRSGSFEILGFHSTVPQLFPIIFVRSIKLVKRPA